ncbi:MAG: hypothetical protein HN561_01865 [Candidatus Scalindua sp.]|nr:hypothetical protein [Candidatus Scalindua sp.]
MQNHFIKILIVLSVVVFVASCTTTGNKKSDEQKITGENTMLPPFGNAEDVNYSKKLWAKMEAKDLNSTPANLYVGGPPHGPVREVLEAIIDGKRVIVKRNFGGEGVSVKSVSQNRAAFLKAITVMAKREDGYDPENGDWFWVKYKPDGSLHTNAKGMKLAGKVAKGMDKGCIFCHQSASGNDLVFIHNKEANAEVVHVNK